MRCAASAQRDAERLHQRLAPLQQEERRAPRRARPEAGQLRQQLDEAVEVGHAGIDASAVTVSERRSSIPLRGRIARSLTR